MPYDQLAPDDSYLLAATLDKPLPWISLHPICSDICNTGHRSIAINILIHLQVARLAQLCLRPTPISVLVHHRRSRMPHNSRSSAAHAGGDASDLFGDDDGGCGGEGYEDDGDHGADAGREGYNAGRAGVQTPPCIMTEGSALHDD